MKQLNLSYLKRLGLKTSNIIKHLVTFNPREGERMKKNLFTSGEEVNIRTSGELVTISKYQYVKSMKRYAYIVSEYPSTFFFEEELTKE